jgi:hypothetical protein
MEPSNAVPTDTAARPAAPGLLDRVIDWSAHNVFLVLLATLFLIGGGVYAVKHTPLDALPDLSDVQVIVYTDYPGQAPQVVEDQVTYPLTTSMLAVPRAKVVRGFSMFGASYVYVIFEDGTDIYWARSRVLEYLSSAAGRLPQGVAPQIGPDATGVGWVYQYAVLGKDMSLADTRSLQDWYVRYQLTKAQGVSEVASIGGFVREYQVTVDPLRLAGYGITLDAVTQAIRASNRDVGGRVVELAEKEYMVRGRGYLRSVEDIADIVLKAERGTPVRVGDVARVELVPAERRGIAELNGEGEVASGIVMARFGQNALDVIANVKAKIAEITPGLPAGAEIVPVYDRSELIERAIGNLQVDAARGEPDRRRRVRDLPAACAQRAGGHHHAAARHPVRLHRHAFARPGLEHHEPGRHRDRDRSDGGCGDRDDRERAQAHRAPARGRHPAAARSGDRARLQGGRAGAVLLAADHHRVLPAGVRARRPGGPAVLAARLHQDLRHGRRRAAVGDPGAGADAVLRARAHPARGEEPGEPAADLAVPADHPGRAALQAGDARCWRCWRWPPRSCPRARSARSSCRRSTKARCSTCRRRCRACR